MQNSNDCLYWDVVNNVQNLILCLLGGLAFVLLSASAFAQNSSITADPGHSRVIEVGIPIILDGSNSTSPAGLRLTYAWSLIEQPPGSLAVISDADKPRPSVVPDLAGDYLAELIVTDSEGNSSAAQTVLLTTNNVPPVAMISAGRMTTVGQSLWFDPEGSYDANGDSLDATWSISSFPSELSGPSDPTEPTNPGENNLMCPVNATETVGTYHVVSAVSNQQNPQLAVGTPLSEGVTETGNNSATTWYGPITMDLTGDASLFVPAGETIQVVLSSAWGTSARAEILISADGENYTSLGTVGSGGSVYGAYNSNILRYDDFVVPAGGARFLQVSQQNAGVRADGVIYNTQCQSGAQTPDEPEEDDQSDLATLIEDEGGRFVFTPNVAGDYSIQLLVEDEAGAQSTDIVNVYVAPEDGSGDPELTNLAPIANAGLSQLTIAGQTVILDGSQSTDINGDELSYKWSILSKPADSFSTIENLSSARASITPDTDRTYILQLEVTDENGLKDYDTVVLSGDFVAPLAISGGPDAGADGKINNQEASVDGSSSIAGEGTGFSLTYEWSVLGLSEGESDITDPMFAGTNITFPESQGGVVSDVDAIAAIDLLKTYNLVSFGDLNSNVDTRGRTLVGGDVVGGSATFATGINSANGIDVLTVVGDIKGGSKNINNGGNVRLGGQKQSHVNLNGGGSLVFDSTVSISEEQLQFIALSDELENLSPNSSIEIPTGQPGPVRLQASPDEDGVAVFNISDGNTLFKNNKVQQIEINANGANSIIVNVGGGNVIFNKGNFVGAANSDDIRRKVIWNFYEANQVKIFKAFPGTILAPNAFVHNKSQINGSVVGARILERAPIGFPLFGGEGLSGSGTDEDTDFALVQLAVIDTNNLGLAPSYSSTVLTTGNLRPFARITQSSGPSVVTPGIEVGFNGTTSFDGDNDSLSYNWSVLSKPADSSVEVVDTSVPNISVTPDVGGLYIVQLVVSDGELASRPVTLAIEAQNTAPTANAGPNQSVFKGDLVALDGSGSSDPDGDEITYAWSITEKPVGSLAQLSEPASVSPEFVADLNGGYVVSLTVNDGIQNSTADTLMVSTENRTPLAVITGPSEGISGDMITLSGLGSSDPDGDILTYVWALQTPTDSSAALNNNTAAAPMFSPDEGGIYSVTLVVSDGTDTSIAASLSISITGGNKPPVLDVIGEKSVALGQSLTFSASASDPDGDSLSFFINPTPLPGQATFDTQTGLFSFIPTSLTPSVYELSFGVTDGSLVDSETITVSVTNENARPTTEYTGRVVDGFTGNPIAGVTVKVGDQVTTTNSDGIFTVTGLQSGPNLICIEPNGTTPPAPNGNAYASTEFTVSLLPDVLNDAGAGIELFASGGTTAVSPGQMSTVTNDAIGASLEVPADGFETIGISSRYWRIFMNSGRLDGNPTRYNSLAELELRSRIGGGSILVNGVIGTNSDTVGRSVENVLDGDPSSFWITRLDRVPAWISYDLGVGNETIVSEIVITAEPSNIGARTRTPVDFDVQTSIDGVNWVDVKNFQVQEQWSAGETREFVLSTSYNGPVSLSSLSAEQANILPPGVIPCQLLAIEPKGIVSVAPSTLTTENFDNLPAGSPLDLWAFKNGRFNIVGTGLVTPDGQSIVATLNNISGGDLIALAPRTGAVEVASDVPGRTYVPGLLNEGNFSTSLSLPGYISNSQNRALSFVYNSTAAAPTPIIAADYRAGALVPKELSAQVEIGGVRYGVDTSLSTGEGDNALSAGEIARQAVQLDAGNLTVGRNPFKFISTSKYACSSVTSETTGEVFVDNQIDSPFGRGWTMAELSRIYPQDNGSVLIREGTGQIKDFKAETDFSTLGDPIRLPLLGPSNGEIFDLDKDGDNDIVWRAEERGGLVIYENLGDGNFEEKTLLIAGNVSDVPDSGTFPSDITGIAVGDVDNDGVIDIVVGTQTSDDIFIFFGSPNGLDAYNKVRVDDTDSRAISIGDMDGDGIDDIISFGGSLGGNSYFYKGGPTRSFIRQRLNGSTDARAVIGLTLADFNGDGLQDAFARTSRGFYVFRGVVDDVPAFSTVRSTSTLPVTLGRLSAVTDFTKDGLPDYIIGNRTGGIALYRQNDNGTFSGVRTLTIAEGDVSEFDLADLNGDGIQDILATSGSKVVTWFGLEEGDYAAPEVVETGFGFASPRLGDLNGDGAFDVVGDSQATDELLLYFSDPTRSSRFIDPLTDYTELTKNEDGSYTRRYNDGTVLEYNAAGLQTSITDSNGNATLYAYDSEERVTSITDPVGLVTTFTYGAGGKLSRIDYPDGRSTQWDYNVAGDLVRYQDVNGDVTTHNYDEAGRLTAQTDPRGLITEHSYGPYGRYQGATLSDGTEISLDIAKTLGLPDLGGETGVFVPADQRETTLTDGRGNVTITEVNALGSPIRVTDPLGRVTLYERDINNNVTAMIAPSSVTISGTIRSEFDYDAQGNVIAKRDAVGTALQREMSYAYEPVFNKVISMTDYGNFETLYTYDDAGNILTETDPLGGVQSFSYDAAGLPLTSTDKNDNLTSMFYSLEGRIERMTDPSGTVTTYTYDGAGNLISMIEDALGDLTRETVSSYDEKNRMLTETAADGGVTTYVYDGNNNVTSITDPTGIVETRSYDNRDRLETINDPAIGATIMAYDADSNLIRQTDGSGEVSTFEYDEVSRLIQSTDAISAVRRFAYDLRDNRTSVTDARGNVTLFSYDSLDRAISRTNPASNVWQFGYDLRDNRITSTKPDGVVLTSSYDDLSRMLSLVGGDIVRNYAYDPQSNLLTSDESFDGNAGTQIEFSYDVENRVATATTSNLFGAGEENNSFSFDYDTLDRRQSMTDGFGGTTAYAYDDVSRLTSITSPQSDNFTITYDLAGRKLRRAAPNASEIMRNYEALTGRLARHTQTINGAVFNDFTYSYTVRGNIASIVEEGEITRTRLYSYDAIERLTDVTVPERPFETEVYELDAEGNRLSSHLSDMNTTDAANRLTSDDNYTYIYDLNGNLTGKLAKAGTGLSNWSYDYDALDQLVEVSQDGDVVESYRYDAFGRRSLISTVEGAGLTTDIGIINQGTDRVLDIANDNVTGATLSKRYTHGAIVDAPLQLESFDAGGIFEKSYTYHPDHLGSIRYLTDSSGVIVNSYDYDSYGRPQFGITEIEQPFQYTGREWDAATGLYYYRARAYDADTGRFLQEDPIFFSGGDLNIYRYVGSNPINFSDPSGLSSAAIERTAVSGIGIGLVTGGRAIAKKTLLEGGRALARVLQSGQLNRLAGIGGQINCKLFSVAAAINTMSPANEGICGAGAGSQSEDEVIVTSPNPGGGGDCTDAEHRRRQDSVEEQCGRPQKCRGTDTVGQRAVNIRRIRACVRARVRINNQCFRGGNQTHKDAIGQRLSGLGNCYTLPTLGGG